MMKFPQTTEHGFSLSELLAATVILGTLASIATPAYIQQLEKGKQGEAETLIAQLITQASAFNDEFGSGPTSWKDLDEIAAIPMQDGFASKSDFTDIVTPSGNYRISAENSGNKYTFSAKPEKNKASNYNVVGCSNIVTGASQIISGSSQKAASAADLKC